MTQDVSLSDAYQYNQRYEEVRIEEVAEDNMIAPDFGNEFVLDLQPEIVKPDVDLSKQRATANRSTSVPSRLSTGEPVLRATAGSLFRLPFQNK